MRDRFNIIVGLAIAAIGGLWMLGMATDADVPWEWVLPGTLVVLGLLWALGARGGGTGGGPSQFERDDAPRVP